METSIDRAASLEREWWRRAVSVLTAPRSVFAAMRADSEAAAAARQEPILAILLIGGISVVLGTTIAGRLLDDPAYDPLLIAVWAVVGGAMYAAAAYFLVGGLLALALRLAGSRTRYRTARHVVGLAAAPLAVSLLVWPVRIAVYGEDVFRTGGSDRGLGNDVFEAIETSFLVWSVALIAVGVHELERWSWPRSAAVTALPALAPALALGRAYGVI